MKNRWIVSINDELREYPLFEDAVMSFKFAIVKEINKAVIFSHSVPVSVASFFSGKYDSYISDEEIVIEQRVGMLLRTLNWKDVENTKKDAAECIRKSYFYKGKDEFDDELQVDITLEGERISITINYDDGRGDDAYLMTNAFNLDDQEATYYFNSSQVITGVDDDEDSDVLGERIATNIFLYKITDVSNY